MCIRDVFNYRDPEFGEEVINRRFWIRVATVSKQEPLTHTSGTLRIRAAEVDPLLEPSAESWLR